MYYLTKAGVNLLDEARGDKLLQVLYAKSAREMLRKAVPKKHPRTVAAAKRRLKRISNLVQTNVERHYQGEKLNVWGSEGGTLAAQGEVQRGSKRVKALRRYQRAGSTVRSSGSPMRRAIDAWSLEEPTIRT